MAKFLFVYRNTLEDQCQPSPEEMQEAMAKWGAWFEKLGSAVIDGGDGLLPEGRTVKGDGTVTDGPFIEAKELVGGYSILQAESLEEAAGLSEGCPVLEMGGTVEIRQLAGYSDNQGE